MSQITVDGGLYCKEISAETLRVTCMRHRISSTLARQATTQILASPWSGATLYIIDTLTNRGARITYIGDGTFDLKVSSRTGDELLDALAAEIPAEYLDHYVIID